MCRFYGRLYGNYLTILFITRKKIASYGNLCTLRCPRITNTSAQDGRSSQIIEYGLKACSGQTASFLSWSGQTPSL